MLTIEEIEAKVGKYHHSSNKFNVVKMWEAIGENYEIHTDWLGNTVYVISDELYNNIKQTISKTVVNLQPKLPAVAGQKERNSKIKSVSQWKEEEEFIIRMNKREEQNLKKQQEKKELANTSRGVYGIFYKGQLIYVGMTTTSFAQRKKEHLARFNCQNKDGFQALYHANLNPEELEFYALVDISKVEANREISERDIKAMELGFITYFKPKYNIAGVRTPYQF